MSTGIGRAGPRRRRLVLRWPSAPKTGYGNGSQEWAADTVALAVFTAPSGRRPEPERLMRHSPAAECLCVSSAASSSRLVVPVFAIALYIWPSTVRTDTVNRSATSLFDRP